MTATDRLRAHLQTALTRKVDAHGLVVWDDPAGEYGREVAEAVCPPDTRFAGFEGSWYALRRSIETELAGGPLVEKLDQNWKLERACHWILFVGVDHQFGSRFDVLDRNAYAASRPGDQFFDLGAQNGDIRRPGGRCNTNQEDGKGKEGHSSSLHKILSFC